jgi:urea transport system permease protein
MTISPNAVVTTIVVMIAIITTIALPRMIELFDLMQITVFICMSILAISLGFIWGFGGILCFGQAAFFGIGAYTYAVAAINIGESTVPLLLAILVPSLFAGALGYFMFYGRISDVYLGVITLTVTLILFNVINSTAGDQYRIGTAALGGFNGIPSVPGLNMPFMSDWVFGPEENWYVSAGALIAVYVALRLLLAGQFGRVVVAIRENEIRAALLGYDPRTYKLIVFMIGGGIAGLGGCLFTVWGAFVSPTIFGLATSAQIIIWVTVGGLGTLVGPILGCIAIQYLTSNIGEQQYLNANLILGAILLVFVLLIPSGVIPTARTLVGKALARIRPSRSQPNGIGQLLLSKTSTSPKRT